MKSKKSKKRNKKNSSAKQKINPYLVALLIIMLTGGFFRFWALDFDSPINFTPDEKALLNSVNEMTWTDFNPHWFVWPGAQFDIFFIAKNVYDGVTGLNCGAKDYLCSYDYYMLFRIITALMGTLSIPLLYLVTNRLYKNKNIALLAALFLMLTPIHIRECHTSQTMDIAMIFWGLLMIYASTKIIEKNNMKWYILSGVFAGLAFGSKYPGAGLIIIPSICYLYANFNLKKNKLFIKDKNLLRLLYKPLILGGVFFLTFLLTTPTIFLDWPEFEEKGFSFIVGHVGQEGHDGFDLKPEGWIYNKYIYQLFAAFPFSLGIALYLLAFAGLIYAFIKHKKEDILLLAFFIGYFLVTGSWIVVFVRYYLILMPLFAIFGARFAVEIYEKYLSKSKNKIIRYSMHGTVILILIYTFVLSFSLTSVLANSTRYEAQDWFLENIDRNSTVLRSRYTPYVGHIGYVESTGEKTYPSESTPDDFVLYYPNVDRIRYAAWNFTPDYIIIDEANWARFYKEPKRYQTLQGDPHYLVYFYLREQGKYLNLRKSIMAQQLVLEPQNYVLIKKFEGRYFHDTFYKSLDPMYFELISSPGIEIYKSSYKV